MSPKHRTQQKGFRLGLAATGLLLVALSMPHFASGEETAPAPAAPAANPKKFRKSRLTKDESEGLADKRKMLLSTGEDKIVDLDFEPNSGNFGINVGNPKVVATTLVKLGEKRQIVFKPLAKGDATVVVRDVDGIARLIFNVKVTDSNLLRQAGEIRNLLRDVEGIDVRVVGQKIIIDGEVLVPNDYGRLAIVAKQYETLVVNLASLSPLALQVLSKKIQQDINAFAPNVTTRVVNGVIFLEGTVDDLNTGQRAAEVAKTYLPESKPQGVLTRGDESAQVDQNRKPIRNFIVVNAPPPKKAEKLVRVTVHYVELSKDYTKNFGFKWEPGFTSDPSINIGTNGSGAVGGGGTSFTATISSLFPKLQSAQNAGFARILKTGTVIVRSGQPGSLSEGTDIPYTKTNPNGTTETAVQSVGFELNVTPQILGQSDDISMDLDLRQSNMTGRTPAAVLKSTHNVKTKLYVKSNESAAVAGVVTSDVGTDFNKDDPNRGKFEGNTDPLFTLLHSKAFRKKKSQFVIFVTPQVIDNASEGTEDLKRNFRVKVK